MRLASSSENMLSSIISSNVLQPPFNSLWFYSESFCEDKYFSPIFNYLCREKMQLMGTKEYKYLTNVDSPTELRALSVDELPQFCDELRDYIIEQCAVNPGHLGSNCFFYICCCSFFKGKCR